MVFHWIHAFKFEPTNPNLHGSCVLKKRAPPLERLYMNMVLVIFQPTFPFSLCLFPFLIYSKVFSFTPPKRSTSFNESSLTLLRKCVVSSSPFLGGLHFLVVWSHLTWLQMHFAIKLLCLPLCYFPCNNRTSLNFTWQLNSSCIGTLNNLSFHIKF